MTKYIINYLIVFLFLSVELNAQMKGFSNPAATYCTKLGYEFVISQDSSGNEIGQCILPDGSNVNAWDFYKGKIGQEYSYCNKKGYEILNKEIEKDGYSYDCPYCVKKNNLKSSNSSTDEIPLEDLMNQNGDTLFNTINYIDTELPESTSSYEQSNSLKSTSLKSSTAYPISFDWRNYGGHTYIGPIRDQGDCNSCYAFAGVACAEGAYNKAAGLTDANCVQFSEQFIMWCLASKAEYSGSFGGCNGGKVANMYFTAMVNEGICPRNKFDPEYSTSQPSYCTQWNDANYKFASWQRVECNNIDAIKDAIMNHGIVQAFMFVGPSIQYWGGDDGIYSDNSNSCTGARVNHAVAIVGWGHDAAKGDYWIVRNSWGSDWGENGYMRITVKAAYIASSVTYLTGAIFQNQSSISKENKLNSNDDLSLISAQMIYLNPGFSAETGSKLKCTIGTIPIRETTTVSIAELDVNTINSFGIGQKVSAEIQLLATNMYPNPTMGILKLVDLPIGIECTIELFKINGDLLESNKCSSVNFELDLTNYPNDVYIVKIITGTKTYFTKIVKH